MPSVMSAVGGDIVPLCDGFQMREPSTACCGSSTFLDLCNLYVVVILSRQIRRMTERCVGPEHHEQCKAARDLLAAPLITTWPCFTEAMYFLGEHHGGWYAQEKLWDYLKDGIIVIHDLSEAEVARMRELMEKYKDRPMDLADASLVATAESENLRRIFTLDKTDFSIYRIHDKDTFDIVP